MHPSEKPEFAAMMMGIAELYSKKLSNTLLDIYWATLSSFEFETVKVALNRHVVSPDNGEFMPKPADVVRYIQGDSQTQALQAWTKVFKTIQTVGAYKSVIFDDPIIQAVIDDMGGWIKLCSTTEKELVFHAREFEKRYAGYILQPPQYYPKKLIGIIEQANQMMGYVASPPLLIGDPTRAKQIYLRGSEPKFLAQPLFLTSQPSLVKMEEESSCN